jgi:deoxyribodipyrimidine photo-lyase
VRCTVVLFNRDLRVHDHPALHHAVAGSDRVIPLFVLDPGLVEVSPNRTRFLLDCLDDLRAQLRRRGGDLIVARGDPVEQTVRLAEQYGAGAVFASADVTPYARRREAQLAKACDAARLEWRTFEGVGIVAPGQLAPAGGDHYRVFTPYWKVWRVAPHRRPLRPAPRVDLPVGIAVDPIPSLGGVTRGTPSPELAQGGETVGRQLLHAWVRTSSAAYADRHDDLAADATSRLSPYLHFGCVSPAEVAAHFDDAEGEPLLRQLCWRDFFLQVTSAFGAIATDDYKPRRDRWRRHESELEAWASGQTGYPIVDAGMRQLQREGWMHNRARLITASFLTKDLYLDWRTGAAHFLRWLVDGDVANNSGNWQWVAGTGHDPRPSRMFNPLRQAERFDPEGDYVRRYVEELATLPGPAVHRPWALDPAERKTLDYPDPIVDHAVAVARFRAGRERR